MLPSLAGGLVVSVAMLAHLLDIGRDCFCCVRFNRLQAHIRLVQKLTKAIPSLIVWPLYPSGLKCSVLVRLRYIRKNHHCLSMSVDKPRRRLSMLAFTMLAKFETCRFLLLFAIGVRYKLNSWSCDRVLNPEWTCYLKFILEFIGFYIFHWITLSLDFVWLNLNQLKLPLFPN